MAISDILASIDHEITQLQQARALLSGGTAPAAKKQAGKPKKAAIVAPVAAKPAKGKKRNVSPEGRKRIAEAVKKRWAAQRAAVLVVPATTKPAKKKAAASAAPTTTEPAKKAAGETPAK